MDKPLTKPLTVRLSRRARTALKARHAPLSLELELFFSCLIRKRLRVVEQAAADALPLSVDEPGLEVHFRPVMSQVCSVQDHPEGTPLIPFPLQRAAAFSPRWLSLDYRAGSWRGEFGFDSR
jgi:hypothetical protein